jgi:hypothetical protein
LWNLPRTFYNTLNQSAYGVVYFIELSQHIQSLMKTLHDIFDYWKVEIPKSKLLEWGLGFFINFVVLKVGQNIPKFLKCSTNLH